MSTHDDPRMNTWEDLIIAMLAVNNYSLERAYSLRDGLASQGLFDIEHMLSMSAEEIASRLDNAGHKRGGHMNRLLSHRLYSLCRTVDATGRAQFEAVLKSTDANLTS